MGLLKVGCCDMKYLLSTVNSLVLTLLILLSLVELIQLFSSLLKMVILSLSVLLFAPGVGVGKTTITFAEAVSSRMVPIAVNADVTTFRHSFDVDHSKWSGVSSTLES